MSGSWCRARGAMLIASVLLHWGAATAAAEAIVYIHFENYAVGSVIPAYTEVKGNALVPQVFFDHAIQILDTDQFPPFATGHVATNYDDHGGDISGGFSVPVPGFSISVGDRSGDLDSALLQVFDSNHNLLGGQQFQNSPSGGQLTDLSCQNNPCGIKYFTITQQGGVVFDNITIYYKVPEPGSLLLLGVAALSLAARLRQPRRAPKKVR